MRYGEMFDTGCPMPDCPQDVTVAVEYAPATNPDECPELLAIWPVAGEPACEHAVGRDVPRLSNEAYREYAQAAATAEEQRAYDRYEDAQEAKYQTWRDQG